MLVTLLRTSIVFVTLIVVMRLMGKRQIGEMQPFEFIVTLIIADLACIPMADVSIPLIYGLVAILGLFILHQLLSILEQSGPFLRTFISGKPSVVINKNGVDLVELKKNNMDINDLLDSMRSLGYFALDELDYAIFESNGKLSAFQKSDAQKSTSIPLLIVSDGKVQAHNLNITGITKEQIMDYISTSHTKLKNIEVLTIDGDGKAYLKQKNEKYKVIAFPLPTGVKW